MLELNIVAGATIKYLSKFRSTGILILYSCIEKIYCPILFYDFQCESQPGVVLINPTPDVCNTNCAFAELC